MTLNVYELQNQKIIPAVIVYAFYKDEVLLISKTLQSGDGWHQGTYNGLGGKIEKNESSQEAAKRELFEESGLDIAREQFKCVGVLQFPNFKPHKTEDWICYVFTLHLETFPQNMQMHQNEGMLQWVKKKEVLDLSLWEGDRIFLPMVFAGRSFVGTFWYENKQLVRHWMQSL